MRDEVCRPRLQGRVRPSDVLTEDAEGQQLHRTHGCHDDHGRGPARQRVAEKHLHDRVDEHPERGDAAHEAEPGREPERGEGEARHPVEGQPDHPPQRVLRLAGGPRSARVAHRRAREAQGRHHQTQHATVLREGVDRLDRRPGHEAEVARVDVGVHVGQRPDRPVEQPGREPLEDRVRRPVLANPVDDVHSLAARHGQHLADDLWRVLQVRVDGDDPATPRSRQTGGDRRLVPGIGPQPDDAHLGPLPTQSLQHHGGGVRGPVVDAEHLVRRPPRLGDRSQPLDEQGEDRLLVVEGDDDAHVDEGVRHGPRVGRHAASPRSNHATSLGGHHRAGGHHLACGANLTTTPPRRVAPTPRLRAPEYEIGGPRCRRLPTWSSRSDPRRAPRVGHATVAPPRGAASTQAVGRGTCAVARMWPRAETTSRR